MSSRDPRASLAAQPTRLVGREVEVAALVQRLLKTDVRLLTLTGVGGVGKTRLAIATAERLEKDFAEGVCFVDLAPVRDPTLVLGAIQRSLGLIVSEPQEPMESLRLHLADAKVLLLLDNFEHVALAAPVLSELLGACRGVKVMVTSRRPLHLRWEHEWPVTPLAARAAVELFGERARARDPSFAPTPDDDVTIVSICERLDRLPLAIELAAARAKVLSPSEMLARLEKPLRLLSDGAIDLPERQRSLADTIAWSHALLSPDDQALFEQVALFVGGCTVDAVASVGLVSPERAAEGLAALVDESLLSGRTASVGGSRFRMLETVREFALERAAVSGRLGEARRRHALYFLELAERVEPDLYRGTELDAYARLELEHDNVRAALRALLDAGDGETAARLAVAVARFWHTHGYLREAQRWLDEVLAVSAGLETPARAHALSRAADMAVARGEPRRAIDLYEESLALARKIGLHSRVIGCLNGLAFQAIEADDLAGAATLYEEALAIARATGDKLGLRQGLFGSALGARLREDVSTAKRLFEEQNDLARDLGSRRYLAHGFLALAEIAEVQADGQRAARLCRDSLTMFRELGGRRCISEALGETGWVLALRSEPEAAATLFAAADALRERIGYPYSALEKRQQARRIAVVRQGVGPEAFERAWARGGTLTIDAALDLALASIGKAGPPAQVASVRSKSELTRREMEVARLVAQGMTNHKIAESLVIGERTVDTHVENILHKLDLSTRAQVAVWVTERRIAVGPA